MSTKKLFAGILVGAVFVASSSTAASYKCNVRLNGHYGGIPSVLVFSVNEEETKAVIYYALIKKLYDRPIEANLVVANPKRFTFKWTVDVPTTDDARTKITTDYRATYMRRTHKISVSGFPKGYDIDVGGTGKCIPLK